MAELAQDSAAECVSYEHLYLHCSWFWHLIMQTGNPPASMLLISDSLEVSNNMCLKQLLLVCGIKGR
jgi:hypothetical protein